MSLKNRKYKDSVFTDLFGSDKTAKENFLSLYNALSGSDFKLNKVSMERKIIEQSLYKTFNNDVSWEINGKLIVLVEHQSTINENMPFRCLEYVTRIYEEIIPIKTRYSEKVFKLPNPDFYVVYVGKKDYPKEKELKLSDAFYVQDGSKLELVVQIKNCSDSKFLPLFQNCDILKQYCRFIEIVEENYNERFPKRSFKKAIEQAMSEEILTDYLDRKSREVINMLCAKYDYKMDIAVKQEEAFADGKAEGHAEGLVEGIEQGSQQKAIEAAIMLIKKYKATPETAAQDVGAPLDKVLELQKSISVEA